MMGNCFIDILFMAILLILNVLQMFYRVFFCHENPDINFSSKINFVSPR